jgi:hypothetical protein
VSLQAPPQSPRRLVDSLSYRRTQHPRHSFRSHDRPIGDISKRRIRTKYDELVKQDKLHTHVPMTGFDFLSFAYSVFCAWVLYLARMSSIGVAVHRNGATRVSAYTASPNHIQISGLYSLIAFQIDWSCKKLDQLLRRTRKIGLLNE